MRRGYRRPAPWLAGLDRQVGTGLQSGQCTTAVPPAGSPTRPAGLADPAGGARGTGRAGATLRGPPGSVTQAPGLRFRTLIKNQTRMGDFQDRRSMLFTSRATSLEGERIAEASYPECDEHSFAQMP